MTLLCNLNNHLHITIADYESEVKIVKYNLVCSLKSVSDSVINSRTVNISLFFLRLSPLPIIIDSAGLICVEFLFNSI